MTGQVHTYPDNDPKLNQRKRLMSSNARDFCHWMSAEPAAVCSGGWSSSSRAGWSCKISYSPS